MALVKITEGITGEQAANIIYENDLENDQNIQRLKGEAMLKEDYIQRTANFAPLSSFGRGYWYIPFEGSPVIWGNSINQLSSIMVRLPQTEKFTVSGLFTPSPISEGAPRAVYFDADGILLSYELGNGEPVQTFTRPTNAVYGTFSIANQIDIGVDPQNNVYAQSFMLNEGETALPYEPYGALIDPDKIAFNFEDVVTEESLTKLRSIENAFNVSTSTNKIDKNSQLAAGQYVYNAETNNISANTSVNWIRFLPIELKGGTYTLQGVRPTGGSGVGNVRLYFTDLEGEVLQVLTFADTGNAAAFTFTTPWGVNETGRVGGNVANVIDIGLNPTENGYADTVMLSEGAGVKPYEPYGELVLIDASHVTGLDVEGADLDKIIIVKPSATSMTIYWHTGGNAANWFGVGFRKFTNTARFMDFWRIDRGVHYRRTGEFSFTAVNEVIQTGVWENAIYTTEAEYNNALGSSHGWEMMQSVSATIDGAPFDLDDTGFFKASSFDVLHVSDLVTADGANTRAVSTKTWLFEGGLISTENNIVWEMTTGIGERSFVAMLPVNRRYNDVQITNRAMRNTEWQLYDVSQTGFSNFLANDRNNDASTMFIEGLLYSAEMAVQATPVLPLRGFWIQNSELYNKLYFQLGQTTAEPSDVWNVKAQYLIKIK